MNGPRPHPLDNLIQDDSLFLLEAMVPFVDYQYKKPLVLYIKYKELTAIMKCLDNRPYIAECGFDCHPKSTEDMITDMCRFLPGNYSNSIKQMKQMMKMMEVMNMNDSSGFSNFFNQGQESCSPPPYDFGKDSREPPSYDFSQDNHEPPPYAFGQEDYEAPSSDRSLYESVMSILNEEEQ